MDTRTDAATGGPPRDAAGRGPDTAEARPLGRRDLASRLLTVLRHPLAQTAYAGLAGVVLTIAVLPPPVYNDSTWVWRAAESWPAAPADVPALHHAMRLGLVLPTHLMQQVFGPGQTAWVVASAMLMALFTAGVFAIGRSLFNTWIGFLAVAIVIVHPMFIRVDPYTTNLTTTTGSLLPDVPAAGLFALGVAAVVVASRRAGAGQVRWLAGAGVCFGLAYLTREYTALMFAAIPVFFVLLRIPWRRLAAPAVPMLALFGGELIHNAIVYGDALARLKVAGEHGAPRIEPLPLGDVLFGFVDGIGKYPLGAVFVAGLILTAVGALVLRERRIILLLVCFVSLWIPLTLLGGLLDPWEPHLRINVGRYWNAVLAPIVVGGLATIKLLLDRLGRWNLDPRPLRALLAVVLAAYLATAAVGFRAVHRDEDWRQLREWFAAHPEVTVLHTDGRTSQTAGFYTRTAGGEPLWPGTFRTFPAQTRFLPTESIGHDPYLESPMGAQERPDPAKGWRLLWRSDNGVLTIWQR